MKSKWRDADPVCRGSKSLVGKTIRWFTREDGEPTRCNHVGMLGQLTPVRWRYLKDIRQYELPREWMGEWCVFEADWKIQTVLWSEYRQTDADLWVFRNPTLKRYQCGDIIEAAMQHQNGPYAFKLLGRLAMDKTFNTHFTERSDPELLICSRYLAQCYATSGIYEWDHVSANGATPDDIWDECQKPPWEQVWTNTENA